MIPSQYSSLSGEHCHIYNFRTRSEYLNSNSFLVPSPLWHSKITDDETVSNIDHWNLYMTWCEIGHWAWRRVQTRPERSTRPTAISETGDFGKSWSELPWWIRHVELMNCQQNSLILFCDFLSGNPKWRHHYGTERCGPRCFNIQSKLHSPTPSSFRENQFFLIFCLATLSDGINVGAKRFQLKSLQRLI